MTEAAETTGIAPKKKTSFWLWAGVGTGVMVIAVIVVGSQTTGKPKEDSLAELANAQPSALRAEGELSELFALDSKNTDLQRDNKLKEIKGQIVQWQLPVYEVSRSGDGYKVQTKSGVRVGPFGQDLVGAFIYIKPRDDSERQSIEALKTDDPILFRGRNSGSSLRTLVINPAMLVVQSMPTLQGADAAMAPRRTEPSTALPTPVTESVPAPAALVTPLSKIVTPSLLGVTLKYAEHQIGVPAMRKQTDAFGIQHNYYDRGGCWIELGIEGNKVVSVGAYVAKSPECDVDVSDIVNRPGAMASKTTFKDYAWRGQLHFTSTQIPSCNACWEGRFNAMIDGVGALDKVDIQLEGDDSLQGFEKWDDYLRENGMDWEAREQLPMTGPGCPLRKFDAKGYEFMQNTPVLAIHFGRHGSLQPQCSGKAVQDLQRRSAHW